MNEQETLEARKRLKELLEKTQSAVSDLFGEEVNQLIDDAIQAVRREMRESGNS